MKLLTGIEISTECESCIHKNVCSYNGEDILLKLIIMGSLLNKNNKSSYKTGQTEKWLKDIENEDVFDQFGISIACKHYEKGETI